MVNLLSMRTSETRYYISNHFSNDSKCLISHFWQALIFHKTLHCIRYLKSSSFSFQLKINRFNQGVDVFQALSIFHVGKLSNFIYLNKQWYHQGCNRSVFHQRYLNLLFWIVNREKQGNLGTAGSPIKNNYELEL